MKWFGINAIQDNRTRNWINYFKKKIFFRFFRSIISSSFLITCHVLKNRKYKYKCCKKKISILLSSKIDTKWYRYSDVISPSQALDGFLFVVNTEGRVEHVTDNITQYINYTKDDVLGKDIYNIIHHGDHNNFMPSLLPMSLGVYFNCTVGSGYAPFLKG